MIDQSRFGAWLAANVSNPGYSDYLSGGSDARRNLIEQYCRSVLAAEVEVRGGQLVFIGQPPELDEHRPLPGWCLEFIDADMIV